MVEAVGIRVARPTISIDGQANNILRDGLLGLLIEETTDGFYRCEMSLGNWGNTGNNSIGYRYFDRSVLDFGKEIVIKIDSDALFEGVITGLEANFPDGQAPTITVLAEDQLQKLRMTRRSRSFEDVSVGDIIQQIGGEYQLSPDVDVDSPTYKVIAQVNQSDLAFLRDIVRAVDAELWIENGTLYARNRSDRDAGELSLRYGSTLREFSVLADLAMQRSKVIVSGWDVETKNTIDAVAEEQVIRSELGDLTGGSSILTDALDAHTEVIAHSVPFTTDEAQARADAYFRQSARRFVVGHGLADTDARMRVGASIELRNLGDLFDGKYTMTAVRHVFDSVRGFFTEFTVERPGIGQL